ncbi:hypothetical protein L6R53_21015 [Myxococcota bacterium]|nr:hypothetical protein [Myxococcota bacterium]
MITLWWVLGGCPAPTGGGLGPEVTDGGGADGGGADGGGADGGGADGGGADDTGAGTDGGGTSTGGVCAETWPEGEDWSVRGPFLPGTRVHLGSLDYGGQPLPFYVRLTYPATAEGVGTPVDPSGGPYPLLIFEHAYGASPEQYDWFVQDLASRGWIVAAPEHDASKWNATEGGFWDSHAWLAEQTLELLIAWAAEPGGEWAGTLDLDRIALGGHSHGGGSVLRLAQSWRPMDPEGPYQVSALALLATRPDMTEEFDRYAEVYDGLPPLLHLVGGAEHGNDLAHGQTIAFPEHGGLPTGVLYVEGADHYSWTDDVETPYAIVLREDVLAIAQPALISFLAHTMEGLAHGRDPWRGDVVPPWSDGIPLRGQWRDGSARVIDSFREGDEGTDASRSHEGFDTVEERWAFDEARSLYSTTWALELAWTDNAAEVRWDLGEIDLTGSPVLSLRLLALHDDPLNPRSMPLDMEIEVADSDGDIGAWALSDSPQGGLRPTPYWYHETPPKSVFETWRIKNELDLSRIAQLRIRPVSSTGRVLLDDLEWSEGLGCW